MPNLLLYTTQDKKVKVELYELGESVFLAQDAMAKLFDTSKQNISLHIRNILQEGELQEDSVECCGDCCKGRQKSRRGKADVRYQNS